MASIPGELLDVFDKPAVSTVATVLPDGQPQVTPVWVDYDGSLLRFGTRQGTQKHRNLERTPKATITVIDPDDYYRYLEARGEVASIQEAGALEFIDRQAQRYWGLDEYPYRRDQPRVLVSISPDRVVTPGVESPD